MIEQSCRSSAAYKSGVLDEASLNPAHPTSETFANRQGSPWHEASLASATNTLGLYMPPPDSFELASLSTWNR